MQLDLSIHVLGTLPKIPYPDTKVFSLAAAWGSTCFLNIWIMSWQIVHAGPNEPRLTGPMSLHQQLFWFGWTHGIRNKSDIITTTQIATCLFFSVAVVWIIVLENLWITFVAYSARWRGVSFCYIKTGRSNMWPWIEVILLWRLKGVALNLLRPRDNKKIVRILWGRGVCKLCEEVCIVHMTWIC